MHSVSDIRRQDSQARASSYASDVQEAFEKRPFEIATKYLFDSVGSKLFAQYAATVPDYYAHNEKRIVDKFRNYLEEHFRTGQLIEFGAGACPRLSQFVSLGLLRFNTLYLPVDISSSPLVETLVDARASFPGLNAIPCIGDFENWDLAEYVDLNTKSTILWLGNTAANMSEEALVIFLTKIREAFKVRPTIILGIDIAGQRVDVKSRFPDPQKVFSRFRWHALTRLNDTFDGTFESANFDLKLSYNHLLDRAESAFVPTREHVVRMNRLDLSVTFSLSDKLIVGITRDFSLNKLTTTLTGCGWKMHNALFVPESTYSILHLSTGIDC